MTGAARPAAVDGPGSAPADPGIVLPGTPGHRLDGAVVEGWLMRAQTGAADEVAVLARAVVEETDRLPRGRWSADRSWAQWVLFLTSWSDHRYDDAAAALADLGDHVGGRDLPEWDLLVTVSSRVLQTAGIRAGSFSDNLVVDLVRIEELIADPTEGCDLLVLALALNGAIVALMRSMLHEPALAWAEPLRDIASRAGSERLMGVSLLNESESILDLVLADAAAGADRRLLQERLQQAVSRFDAGSARLVRIGLIRGDEVSMLRYGMALRAVVGPDRQTLDDAEREAARAGEQGDWEAAASLTAAMLVGALTIGDLDRRDRARELAVLVFRAQPASSGALTYLLHHLAQRFDVDGSGRTRAAAAALRMTVAARLDGVRRISGSFAADCEQARLVVRAQRHAGQALRDPLTGVGNRRALTERLGRALASVREQQAVVSVGYLDLDDFKSVNERYSHAGGDTVLTAFAGSLDTRLGRPDAVFRYGGDEFVVVLEGCDAGSARTAITAALTAIAQRSQEVVDGGIGATAGVTVLRPQDTVAEVLHRADLALLAAKREAKGVVVDADEAAQWHDPDPDGGIAATDALAASLADTDPDPAGGPRPSDRRARDSRLFLGG